MELSPEAHAAVIKVAGNWAIQIALWRLERAKKTSNLRGNALLQKHFQESYRFLTQAAER